MSKLLKDKTQEYVLFLQKYINDILSGKIKLDKEEKDDISNYLCGLRDLTYTLETFKWTSDMNCFNGNHEMTVKNCEYYMKNLCEEYNLKCIKHKNKARWTVIKNDKKYLFTCHYDGPKDAYNMYNNLITLDYTYPDGRANHEDLCTFSDLNRELIYIKDDIY